MLGTTEELFAVALLLLGRSKGKKETPAKAEDDGAKLVARANQQAAHDWIDTFEGAGAGQTLAEALSRWAGIESSGNPLAVSPIGERGLLQLTLTTQQEGALGPAEWAALIQPSTPSEQHAHMAMELEDWLFHRAARYVANPPDPVTDPTSAVWYAKLYHQRPVDVRDGKLHGPALPMARELAQRWAGDAKAMHRLRAANVVAFGVPNP